MNHVKKVLVAVGAMVVLAGPAMAADATDEGFLMSRVSGAYTQFTTDLGVFCTADQPFDGKNGEPVWFCTGGVDQGIVVGDPREF